mmetsp:Transcript_33212/g.130751  ORF Transcript_33212/g.130751 Transcript_33212/m.130751 type:complete len:438 (-) Transcript_33212:1068-2381(-)
MGAKDKSTDEDAPIEFGGAGGMSAIMVFSHVIPYYLWMCVRFNAGALIVPSYDTLVLLKEHASPTLGAFQIYLGFLLHQALLAVTMPGMRIEGLPVPSEGNKKLTYVCNGVSSWYVTLLTAAVLHYTGVFPLSIVIEKFGEILTVTIITSNVTSVLAYFSAIWLGKAHRMTGNALMDFFMGAWLNPRIGTFDLKFWGETRVAWITLFLLTASCAVKQYEELGYMTGGMWFICTAQWLYSNAVMKGEECIPSTWDIFYEKWGWMLIYWNFAGVPFVYCMPSFYMYQQGPIEIPKFLLIGLFIALFGAYYVWDTSQSQRTRFRLQQVGAYKPRFTFPQLPWGTLKDPKYLTTETGSKLLISGWWKYARKIHYTADLIMASSWALCCGFGSPVPYFYPIFFFGMIVHRYQRDQERCKAKYGKDWEKYEKIVPYVFIPGII